MKPDFRSDEYLSAISHRNKWLSGVPIYDKPPKGWLVVNGTQTQPRGTCWIANGSMFNDTYKSALMWL